MTKSRGLVVVSGNGVGTVSENTAVVLMVWVVIVVVVGDSWGMTKVQCNGWGQQWVLIMVGAYCGGTVPSGGSSSGFWLQKGYSQ